MLPYNDFSANGNNPLNSVSQPKGALHSAPSSAPRRRRSQGNFAKRQALSAIVNDDVSWLVLPHQHSALSRRPVTILPRELQQAVFVTHHPVCAEHAFLLQPEHFVQLSRRGTLPMIVDFSRRRSRVVAIVLGDVMASSDRFHFMQCGAAFFVISS